MSMSSDLLLEDELSDWHEPQTHHMTGADTGFKERGQSTSARKIFGHAHKLINHAP